MSAAFGALSVATRSARCLRSSALAHTSRLSVERAQSSARAFHLASRASSSSQYAQSQLKPRRGHSRGYAGGPGLQGPSEGHKDKAAIGPFNLRAGILFVVTGAGLFFYFQNEKVKVEERRKAETASAKVGRPRIGGPFSLVSASGHPFTHEDLLGSFSLVYFGFTNCPDICPEELDKMGAVVDRVDALHGPIINPVFVSCDPARDTVPQVERYISDFHPRLIGLTGTYESVKAACKAYRVYFSTPPTASPTDDYLVDHSIFFYLMDPEGRFVDAFGRSAEAQEVGDKVLGFIEQWKKEGNAIGKAEAKEKVQNDGRPKVDSA